MADGGDTHARIAQLEDDLSFLASMVRKGGPMYPDDWERLRAIAERPSSKTDAE